MRWQSTAALAVVLVLVGAFYYVYEIRLGPEREKAEALKRRVFTVEPADVTEVALKRAGDTVRAKREGEGWALLEPLKGRGNRGSIDEVVTTITTARMDREIVAAPASLAEFGLDKPAAEVTLTLKDGKQVGLVLGAKSPTGVWVYAREWNKPNVFVLGESVLRDATKPVADLRDRTLLAVDRKDVTALEIATPEGAMTVEAADGKWKLTRPVALPADTEAINALLEKLTAARIKEFVAEAPPSLQPYGLDRPARIAIHTGRDKERSLKALQLGRVDTGKKGVYAMRPGESSVLLLPEDVWTAVPKTVGALRNKVVVDFDRDKLTRVEVESAKGPVTLVQDKDKWRITAPEALPADQVQVGSLLSRLRDLRAQGFVAEDAAGIPRYLAKPAAKVTLVTAAGSQVVLLAPAPDRRGGQPTAYAAIAGRGPVALVDAKVLADVARSAGDLRDRTLVTGLEPRDIARVRVRRDGQTVVLERQGDTDWRLIEPSKGAAKGARVDDLLFSLRALKWQEIVAPAGDAAKYGLEPPAFEVVLFRKDGGELATVQVGRTEAARVFLRTKGSAVYAVDPKQLGDLPKVPDDFKG
jgi:hypothetical protein